MCDVCLIMTAIIIIAVPFRILINWAKKKMTECYMCDVCLKLIYS